MRDDPTILISLPTGEKSVERIGTVCPNATLRIGPHIDDGTIPMSTQLLRGTDIILCEVPPANFDDFDQLQWIQLSSSGYSQVLDLPVLERGIRVTNGLGNFDIPIAEWVVMMMIFWQRHTLTMLDNQRHHRWSHEPPFQRELHGSTVGFYGYGGIARETARLCKAMGLTVWTLTRDGTVKKRHDKYFEPGTSDPDGACVDRVFSPDQLDVFLGGLDYLVLAIPLTPATRGLIGEKELRMLQPEAVLLNVARAHIIAEQALIRCMSENWIRGASIDVHYQYPLPPEHPLWAMPNVVLTPHVAGDDANPSFAHRLYNIFTENLRRLIAGEPLLNHLSDSQLRGE